MRDIRQSKCQLRINNPDAISDIDALEPVQSQYAASSRMLALLVKKAALLDPGRDLMRWYDGEFNPKTAEGVGLDIWGRIVGIGRKLWMENANFFGFAFQNLENFDHAPFWNGSVASGQSALSDTAYRFLVFYKAMANISESTMAAVNQMLNALFADVHGQGSCCVLETGPMHILAVFRFYLTSYEMALFQQYGLLNRPAGVGFSWFQYNPGELFGFAGQELQNFDNGVFTPFTIQTDSPSGIFGFTGQGLQNFDNGVFNPFTIQT